jgi:hypothetical protein
VRSGSFIESLALTDNCIADPQIRPVASQA